MLSCPCQYGVLIILFNADPVAVCCHTKIIFHRAVTRRSSPACYEPGTSGSVARSLNEKRDGWVGQGGARVSARASVYVGWDVSSCFNFAVQVEMDHQGYGTIIGWYPSTTDYAALRCTWVIPSSCYTISCLDRSHAQFGVVATLTLLRSPPVNVHQAPATSADPDCHGCTWGGARHNNTTADDCTTGADDAKASSPCASAAATSAEEPESCASIKASDSEEHERAMAQLLGLPPAFCSAVLAYFGRNRQKTVDFVIGASAEEVSFFEILAAAAARVLHMSLRRTNTTVCPQICSVVSQHGLSTLPDSFARKKRSRVHTHIIPRYTQDAHHCCKLGPYFT